MHGNTDRRLQKVTYAKSKSNVIARLDGTFEPPTAAQTVEVTDLQQSIFNAPAPGSAAAPPVASKPTSAPNGTSKADAEAEAARGQKRTRDEEDEDDDDSDVAMEEDSDDE